jgi:hypothetical protein
LKDTFLGSFDIDFDHNRLRPADNSVEPLHADHSDILVISSRDSIHGVEADSKRYLTLLRSRGTFVDPYKRVQTVDRDVSLEVPHGTGVWLKCLRFCSANARSEHCVTTYIGSNVQKQIALSKEMEREHHVCKFMQANVEIPGCPRHTALECESLSSNPTEKTLALMPTA